MSDLVEHHEGMLSDDAAQVISYWFNLNRSEANEIVINQVFSYRLGYQHSTVLVTVAIRKYLINDNFIYQFSFQLPIIRL